MVYATDLTSFQRLTIMEIYHCAKIMISVIMQIKERIKKYWKLFNDLDKIPPRNGT